MDRAKPKHSSRRPVHRARAEHYLLFTLLGFAGAVILTRVFLELTGYPQVGNRELHIAHVLWGGLLLFVAALLPLILANRSLYTVAALVGGIGVGLFIDEVGKFITQSNDYFYPAAAPIIYAFFLLTILLYLRVARQRLGDARAELYGALDSLQEVLDHDLTPHERAELETRLRHVARQRERPDLARLAQVLLDFLHSDALDLAPHAPNLWERLVRRAHDFEERWIGQRLFKAILIGGLVVASVPTLLDSIEILQILLTPGPLQRELIELLISEQVVTLPNELTWLIVLVALEGLAALPLLIGAILLLAQQEQRGIAVTVLGLLLTLTVVNLLVYYFDQFLSITDTLIQFFLLLLVLRYRRRFLPQTLPQPPRLAAAEA